MFDRWGCRLTQRVAREKTVRLQFEDTVKLPPPVRAGFRLHAHSPGACLSESAYFVSAAKVPCCTTVCRCFSSRR